MKRKFPAKDCFHVWGGLAGPDGETISDLGGWVIPDHWNEDASRWKKAKERGGIILKRSEYARLLRDMRSSGYVFERGPTPFSKTLYFLVREAMEKDLKKVNPRKRGDRKVVAA